MSVGRAPVRRNSFWGWGMAGDPGATAGERSMLAALAQHRFGVTRRPGPTPRPDQFELDPPRITPPGVLAAVCSAEPADRLAHAQGKSFGDLARAWGRRITTVPDLVAYPRGEDDITAALEWASSAGIAVVPYGGGSSVVGGVTPPVERPVVSLDLQRLDRVLEVEPVSRTARVQAGVLGPRLARQLAPHGLVLRHFPQSYEYSSLGGWIATRAGGHFATGRTRIDDFVAAARMLCPAGTFESRRLPGSGAGPDPDRWVCGSEGALGVITEATIRVQSQPSYRAGAVVRFGSFADGADAVREIVQSGLQPANLRLLDRNEAMQALVGDGTEELLLLGFESDHDVDALLVQAVAVARDHAGTMVRRTSRKPDGSDPGGSDRDGGAGESGPAGDWRHSFLRMPFYRDVLVSLGVISETFETAVPWDRFGELDAAVRESVRESLADTGVADPSITCRFTHVYPDGPAPYYTVLARGTCDDLSGQWWAVKQAASEAIERCGGTITHHHAVGRDHMPWYLEEQPQAHRLMLAAAKRAVDPAGILNPGVLVPAAAPESGGRPDVPVER